MPPRSADVFAVPQAAAAVVQVCMQAQPLPQLPNALCHTICRLVKCYLKRRNIPVLVISSAVATPPLEGKRSATSAKAAACAVMAYRGRGAVNAVGPPDVIMADNAASV